MALKVQVEVDTLKAKVGTLQRVLEGLTKQFKEVYQLKIEARGVTKYKAS